MAFSVSVGQAIQFLFRRRRELERESESTTWISRGNRSDFDRVHFKWKGRNGEMGGGGDFFSAGKVGLKAEQKHLNRDVIGFIRMRNGSLAT